MVTAGVAMFWALRLFAPSAGLPERARVVDTGPALSGDLTRLLGAAPVAAPEAVAAAPDAATRFRLTGVVATRTAREPSSTAAGLALISVDGKLPQAYRVGDRLDGQYALLAVGLRSARIGLADGPAAAGFMLDLPPPTPAATGVPTGMAPPPGMPPEMMAPPYQPPPPAMPAPGAAPAPGMAPPGMLSGAGNPDVRRREQTQ